MSEVKGGRNFSVAYIKFSVIAVETDLKEQSIYVHFNKQVDTDTVTTENITVALRDYSLATMSYFDLFVLDDLKTITVKFRNTPVVNADYVLLIQDTLKDLEGNNLDQSLFRNVKFISTVTSTVELVSPVNFEVISTQKFVWKEVGEDLVNKYRIQISSDTAFYDLQIDLVVTDQTELVLGKQLKPGQYFYRMRAESGDDFGIWSETRTFLVQQNTEDKKPDVIDTATTSNLISDIEIENLVEEEQVNILKAIETPESGITHKSFNFMFDEDINTDTLVVSIIRKDL